LLVGYWKYIDGGGNHAASRLSHLPRNNVEMVS
jgi:hypothetical protein